MAKVCNNLGLQTKFMLVFGVGLMAFVLSAAAVVSYFEYSGMEQKLKLTRKMKSTR